MNEIVEHVLFTDRNLLASEDEWLEEEEGILQERHPNIIIEVPYTEENKFLFANEAEWVEKERRLEEGKTGGTGK